MSVQKGKTDVVFSGEMLETWQGVWQEWYWGDLEGNSFVSCGVFGWKCMMLWGTRTVSKSKYFFDKYYISGLYEAETA